MLRFLYALNRISIDVAASAGICCYYFALYLKAPVNYSDVFTLVVVVWWVYTLDHLIDAYRSPIQDRSDRHYHYQRYFFYFLVLFSFQTASLVILLNYLPEKVTLVGTFLGVMVILYFALIVSINGQLLLIKEFLIATLYTAGVWLIPLTLGNPTESVIILIVEFFLIALVNLLLLSYRDIEYDQKNGFRSFTTRFGQKITLFVCYLAIVLLLIWGFYHYILVGDLKVQVILCSMGITLMIVLINIDRIEYPVIRVVADATFFIPLIGLFLQDVRL